MATETIDRLFLELSHVTKATTAKEIRLREGNLTLLKLLGEVQCYCPVPMQDRIRDVIRSAADELSMDDLVSSGGIADSP